MKSSPWIWRSVVNVKSTVKISSIFVAFLENMNFKNEWPWTDSHYLYQIMLCQRFQDPMVPHV